MPLPVHDGGSKFELPRTGFGAHDCGMKSRIIAGQGSTAAAEVYEEFFVPALFAQWAAPMLYAVDAHVGDRLIDVGTGTGVLARAALARPTGQAPATTLKI